MLFACLSCAYLLFDPEGCIHSAGEAMRLWAESVAPSVFPFLVLLPVFTSFEAERVYEKLFGRFFRKLFSLGPAGVKCAVPGLIAGSPACALAVKKAYREGKIDSREALCALVLASGLSPVFLVCGVGQGMFSNALTGGRILISSMAAQVVCALIAARLPIPRRKNCREEERRTLEEKGAISFGVNAALGICGWMVLFSVYTGGLPEFYGAWFEVSKGCAYAAETENETLACAIACLSGACVFMQNAAGIYPAALETALFFTFKCIQCALGTSFFVLTDAFLKRKIEFEADLFTVSAAGAMTLACLILFLFAKEQRKKSYGDQKTGH